MSEKRITSDTFLVVLCITIAMLFASVAHARPIRQHTAHCAPKQVETVIAVEQLPDAPPATSLCLCSGDRDKCKCADCKCPKCEQTCCKRPVCEPESRVGKCSNCFDREAKLRDEASTARERATRFEAKLDGMQLSCILAIAVAFACALWGFRPRRCCKPLAVLLVLLAMAGSAEAQSPNAKLVIESGRSPWNVRSLTTGKMHPVLQQAAERQAQYQAQIGVQGHHGWEQRQGAIAQGSGLPHVVECVAESWPGQDAKTSAWEMFNSWRQSPGHWSAVNGPCTYWGYSMAYCARNRTWYGAAVFGHAAYRVDAHGFRVPASGTHTVNAGVTSSRTANFIVSAPTSALAQRIADAAERARREMALEWIGKEFPAWSQPCPITAQVGDHLGGGGTTSFMFEDGEVVGWRMAVQGSEVRLLDSVIPHEVTHTVFATHFRQPLPRWADEGACTTVEHASERAKQQSMLVDFLRTGRGIPFSTMFAMKDYPRDILPLYSQGTSLASFLIEHRGNREFVAFIGTGLADENWTAAVTKHYRYADLAELQESWLSWVKAGSPPSTHTVAYAPNCANGQCAWGGDGWQSYDPYQQQMVPVAPQPAHDPRYDKLVQSYNSTVNTVNVLNEQVKILKQQKGEPGPAGERGPEGPPGVVDQKAIDAAVAEAIKNLPPTEMVFLDESGKEIKASTQVVKIGGKFYIKPLPIAIHKPEPNSQPINFRVPLDGRTKANINLFDVK